MQAQYTYRDTLSASERIAWRVEDLIGGDRRLDFALPFLPETLARVEGLACLTPQEQRTLNQIRGHGYLYTFGLVEEFILPFVMDHARTRLRGDDYRVRAFLQFASEEAKHIHLFKEFRKAFTEGFGTSCDVIGPPDEIGRAVLAHHPLGIALIILHIEWMTQRHYLDSVKDDTGTDPLFRDLLRHHWMEEAQHAKLDTLMVHALAEACDPAEIAKGVEDYAAIGGMIDAGLMQQVAFDIDSLSRATGRTFSQAERDQIVQAQKQAIRWTFIGSGMTHPNFVDTLGRISPDGRDQVMKMAPAFC